MPHWHAFAHTCRASKHLRALDEAVVLGGLYVGLARRPSAASAVAALVFVWFKTGYVALLIAVPSILLLLVAIVSCKVLKHLRSKAAKVARRTRAGSVLS